MPTTGIECWKCGRVQTNQELVFHKCKGCDKWYCDQHYFADRPAYSGCENLVGCVNCVADAVAAQRRCREDSKWRDDQRRKDVYARISMGSAITGIVTIICVQYTDTSWPYVFAGVLGLVALVSYLKVA